MKPTRVVEESRLPLRTPVGALVANVDLVLVRDEHGVHALYGRCLHRGALLSDGTIVGDDLICGLHGWDYRYRTGISSYENDQQLHRFDAWVEDGQVLVDEDQIAAWERANPQPYARGVYLGNFQDIHGALEEPYNAEIQALAREGLGKTGHHGSVSAMGVPRQRLPLWEDIQIQTAQLATLPLFDDAPVGTELILGPRAKKPLRLDIPLFVSDMSFGALSEEAKTALAMGAELAGTGICSGEGGMLPEEREANSRYMYELASAEFGYSIEKVKQCQAFHFKGGQGAKTGTGGHLPGDKVRGKIAAVRGLPEGSPAISPPRFRELATLSEFREFAEMIRAETGGIPIGFKLSANHIEANLDFALEAGADYIILDGRGGGTGAAPTIFKDNISVPTIPALARARRHLDSSGVRDVTMVITGGLRTAADFVKALALGADGVALSNSALQAIGCLGMRACHTNNCPVGIATQKPHLRARLDTRLSAERLRNFLTASVHLMQVLSRACGHDHLNKLNRNDLVTLSREMAYLSGVPYAGVLPL